MSIWLPLAVIFSSPLTIVVLVRAALRALKRRRQRGVYIARRPEWSKEKIDEA